MSEETLRSKRVFSGRLLKVEVAKVALDGGRHARREIVRHPGAVAVLAREPRGRFIFVRQFRKAVETDLLEVVAGTRAARETPGKCAARELQEETGYAVKKLTHLGYIYTAPGFCNERIDLFLAEVKAKRGRQMTEDDEKITVVLLSPREVKAMIERQRIHDAKTLVLWLLAQRRLKLRH